MRHVSGCLIKHLPFEFREFEIYDRDPKSRKPTERKCFLPLNSSYPEEKCVWLTVGIGSGLINEEKEAKRKYPKCNFFGIEANKGAYDQFEKIGTVIPHAVGVENKDIPVEVMTMDGSQNFVKQDLKIRALKDLLDEYIGSRMIHFASLDIEGMEQFLIEGLMFNGTLTKQEVIFCQIDWEVHYDYQYALIGLKPNKISTLLNLIDNSPYIPILISPHSGYHKITLLNTLHDECLTAFSVKERFAGRPLC